MAASGRVSARRTGRGAHPRRRPTLGAAVAARQRVRGVRTARPPEPTNKGEGGSGWIIVAVLLLVGGGVVAFLVLS